MTTNYFARRVYSIVVLFLAVAGFSTCATAAELRINLVFDNGTVLIYNGKEAGIREGQVLEVARGGQVLGTIEVFGVTATYAQARIVTGKGKIAENDIVLVGSRSIAAAPAVSELPENESAKKKKSDDAGSKTSAKEDKKTDTAKKSSDSGSKSSTEKPAAKKDSGKDASKETSKSSSGSKRQRSASASKSDSGDAAASEEKPADAAPAEKKSSGRGRGRGGSSSSSSSDESSDASAEKTQIEPAVLKREPHYSLHMGYFFVKGDIPGTGGAIDPAFSFSVDYWIPRKRNQNLVYSLLYSRPKGNVYSGGQNIDYQLRVIELSMGLMWDDVSRVLGKDMYAGGAVGWRNTHFERTCEVSCNNNGAVSVENSQEGVDYLGVLGYRATKRTDLKFAYCFDEQYYTLDAGFRY